MVKGIFISIVCLLWYKLVNTFVNLEIFPLVWFVFTQKEIQVHGTFYDKGEKIFGVILTPKMWKHPKRALFSSKGAYGFESPILH